YIDKLMVEREAAAKKARQLKKKCKVKKEAPFVFRITLVQGLNRQIRRMCEYFGYEVKKLERTRIMNVSLSGIPLG
uniref:DUF3811 domain-containing protein n=1 Tax=Escherichia coli TaxID=562 RepID=UPI0016499AFC